MMQRFHIIRFLGLLLAVMFSMVTLVGHISAQSTGPAVTVKARVDRVEMQVGDLLTYELIVIAPAEIKVTLPSQPAGSFGDWEVRSCESLASDTHPEDGTRSGWRCTLTIWKVGEYSLPIQEVQYAKDAEDGVAYTQPLVVKVVSVLDENSVDIKPLKPQLTMNERANLLFIIGLSLLVLLMAAAAMYAMLYYRRRQPIPVPADGPPAIVDPANAALHELDRIARLRLIEEGRIAEHYVLIADVLRTYIRHHYGVPALERTTSEVDSALAKGTRLQPLPLVLLLNEADGVKFAGYLPSPEDAYRMLEQARQAILASK